MAASLRDAPSEADLLVGDVASLPFQDAVFDAVFAFHVIGHLRENDRHRAALEAARVLKGGASLFFLEFGVEDMRAGKGLEVEPNTFRRGGGILTHYFSEGEVLELGFGELGCRYDGRRPKPHPHLICTGCGAISDPPSQGPELDELVAKLAGQSGFAVNSHRFDLFGLCPNCRKGP